MGNIDWTRGRKLSSAVELKEEIFSSPFIAIQFGENAVGAVLKSRREYLGTPGVAVVFVDFEEREKIVVLVAVRKNTL